MFIELIIEYINIILNGQFMLDLKFKNKMK